MSMLHEAIRRVLDSFQKWELKRFVERIRKMVCEKHVPLLVSGCDDTTETWDISAGQYKVSMKVHGVKCMVSGDDTTSGQIVGERSPGNTKKTRRYFSKTPKKIQRLG